MSCNTLSFYSRLFFFARERKGEHFRWKISICILILYNDIEQIQTTAYLRIRKNADSVVSGARNGFVFSSRSSRKFALEDEQRALRSFILICSRGRHLNFDFLAISNAPTAALGLRLFGVSNPSKCSSMHDKRAFYSPRSIGLAWHRFSDIECHRRRNMFSRSSEISIILL